MIKESVLQSDSGGRLKVSLSLAMAHFNAGTPTAVTGELCVRTAVPATFVAGLGYDATGCLCISDGGTPKTYVGGLAVASNGAICVSGSNAIVKYVAGLPVDSVGRLCVTGLVPPVDTDATDWQTRVIANGGTVSAGTLTAVDTFVKAAKTNGYWTKLVRINLFCGDQLAACLVPLKTGPGNAVDTNYNAKFLAADYTEATGLKGNAVDKALKTGIVPNTHLTVNNTHFGVYNRSASNTSAAVGIGTSNSAGSYMRLFPPENTGNLLTDHYDTNVGAGRLSATGNNPPIGFVMGSRVAINDHRLYRRGAQVAFGSGNTGGISIAADFAVFAENTPSVPTSYTASLLAGYSIGAGLTPTEAGLYNTDMQAFQTALGRAV